MRVQGKPQESYMTYTENGRNWFEFIEVPAFGGPGGQEKIALIGINGEENLEV